MWHATHQLLTQEETHSGILDNSGHNKAVPFLSLTKRYLVAVELGPDFSQILA